MSLAETFDHSSKEDQSRNTMQGILSVLELNDLLDMSLKLAAENKINDRNVWVLPLIDHLPEIVKREAELNNFNFQKMSSGLDAGVTIYSRRVEATWKQAYGSLAGCKTNDDQATGTSQLSRCAVPTHCTCVCLLFHAVLRVRLHLSSSTKHLHIRAGAACSWQIHITRLVFCLTVGLAGCR